MLEKVVFLDRDGVINRDSSDYVKTWEEFEFLPGSLDAIALLARHGFPVIIVTNQSSIGRGMISIETLSRTHRLMCEAVAAHGGKIEDIFFCPHTPEEMCDCRKPAPGLVYKARDKHEIDLSGTVFVGDSVKDIECARNAGCGRSILVKTGNGLTAAKTLSAKDTPPDFLADDLLDAVNWILGVFLP
jgi:D-glycero-D-manno-heptose 1,7-bisphosphate phosphatase